MLLPVFRHYFIRLDSKRNLPLAKSPRLPCSTDRLLGRSPGAENRSQSVPGRSALARGREKCCDSFRTSIEVVLQSLLQFLLRDWAPLPYLRTMFEHVHEDDVSEISRLHGHVVSRCPTFAHAVQRVVVQEMT